MALNAETQAHATGRSFRDRLLELASEHDSLQHHVQILEAQLQITRDVSARSAPPADLEVHFDNHVVPDNASMKESVMPKDVVVVMPGALRPTKPLPAKQVPSGRSSLSMDTIDGKDEGQGRKPVVEIDSPGISTTFDDGNGNNILASPTSQVPLTPKTKSRLSRKSMETPKTNKQKRKQRKEAEGVWAILDRKKTGAVSATTMVNVLAASVSSKDCHIFRSESDTAAFLNAVGDKLQDGIKPKDSITKDDFLHVMMEDPLPTFGPELAEKVQMFRETMFALEMSRLVMSRAHLDDYDVAVILHGEQTMAKRLLIFLEPFVMMIVIMNSLMIGLSYDIKPGHEIWDYVEYVFTAVFFAEMLIKISDHGMVEHFFGAEWHWNSFDAVLVLIAMIDCGLTLGSRIFDDDRSTDIGNFTLLRICRLVRISRLLRLLRSKTFKELSLMVNGWIYGMRTILWAIILLMVASYVLALLLRQMTKDDESFHALFKNVPVSMFTVYRCFIGDCSTDDGASLAHRLYEEFGLYFSAGYVLATMFITFGLFNLIMAVFVESTLAIAKTEERRRALNFRLEKLRLAKKIHLLVMGIMRASTASNGPKVQGLRHYWAVLSEWLWPEEAHGNNVGVAPRDSITRENFEKAMLDSDMQAILEDDLEVSLEDTSKIFDALDANGDGCLQLAELVEGLMKLRGPADKLDMLETHQAVRNIQAELSQMKMFQVQQGLRQISSLTEPPLLFPS